MTYFIIGWFLLMGQAHYAIQPKVGVLQYTLSFVIGWLIIPARIVAKLAV